MSYAAININFDSLGEAYGFPKGYHDPSFFEVADRFMAFSQQYQFPYSIYVIGQDLEKPENRAVVKAWAKAGHEIGNHSWSHPMNLGALPLELLRPEIERAHTLITETTGIPPCGFIAPAWSTSNAVISVLLDLGYTYDTSVFPSWLMLPAMAKMALNHFGGRQFKNLLGRKDMRLWLNGPRHVYQSSGELVGSKSIYSTRQVTILPLPTNRFGVACWHTMAFVLGWPRYEKLLRSCLEEVDAFYYLVHPADLMAPKDLDPNRTSSLERMEVPLSTKLQYFERALEIILESGRTLVTMGELAKICSEKNSSIEIKDLTVI